MQNNRKSRVAKVIRTLTVPPILVALMLAILCLKCNFIFRGKLDFIISLLGLGIFPSIAYPMQKVIPGLKDMGRKGQRGLAFAGSVIGYLIAFGYGELSGANLQLKIIFRTYLLSVLLLIFMNKVCKVRASGHACSIIGPLLFLSFIVGWKAAVLCGAIAAASFWASLTLKRHKWSDLVAGAAVCIISYGLAFLSTTV